MEALDCRMEQNRTMIKHKIIMLILCIFIFIIIPAQSQELITDLVIYDSENAQDWSIQSNLQIGDILFGDRDYTIMTIPEKYIGVDWIRSANDSKGYESDPLVSFRISDSANVIIAFDDRLTIRDWLSDWTDTGEDMTNNESTPRTFSLFTRKFTYNDTIELGPVAQTSGANNYIILVKKLGDAGQIPDDFSFNDVFDADLNQDVYSEEITITGLSASTPISITQGAYSINGGSYQSSNGIINNMDQVRIRFKASKNYGSVMSTTLTIGAVSTDFNIQTIDDPESGWAMVPGILSQINPPVFPDRDFNIIDFGAIGDGETICTEAFQQAISACSDSGGGRVIVPEGEFLTGAIHLKSNVNLYLTKNAMIKFSQDPEDFLPVVYTRFEGTECYNYSPPVYAFEQENIAITGQGSLDGQGDYDHWWNWTSLDDADISNLRQQAEDGVSVEERIYGNGHYLRPNMIQPYRCTNVLFDSVNILNGPMWHIHPVLCENVTVSNVSVNGHGPNNDGCNPESCTDVLIKNCFFNTGDDCIAIKSGRNADGRRVNVPTENVVIQNCTMNDGHGGVVIGSEMSGSVRNVFAEDCYMDSPNLDRALRIKTNSMRGGIVENVYLRNITVGQVADAVFRVNFYYGEGDVGDFTPVVHNVEIRNLTCEQSNYALRLQGYPRSPVSNIRLVNCEIENASASNYISNVQNLGLNQVTINDDFYQKIWYPFQEDPVGIVEFGQNKWPESLLLMQNYPNPFNPFTRIEFRVLEKTHVKLKVYDILGNLVSTLVDEIKSAGHYSVRFDGSNLSSGIYVYRLSYANIGLTKKMVLIK
jgi:polygalacturonase